MSQQVRLPGVKNFSLQMLSDGPDYMVQVQFRPFYVAPSSVRYARATSGGDVVTLSVSVATGVNAGWMQVGLPKSSFQTFGPRVWQIEAGFVVDLPGTDNDAEYIFCAGTIAYRVITPDDVTNTLIAELGGGA